VYFLCNRIGPGTVAPILAGEVRRHHFLRCGLHVHCRALSDGSAALDARLLLYAGTHRLRVSASDPLVGKQLSFDSNVHIAKRRWNNKFKVDVSKIDSSWVSTW
jgi:hypothetical protein